MRIAAVGRALPEHYYDQETLLAALKAHWGPKFHNPSRIEQLHRNVRVGGRHLALPIERYPELASFGAANDAWIGCALELGEQAVRDALERAGLLPRDVRHLFFVTVTGIATPSIDARLVNRLGLRSDVKRTPIFGLGCVAGAAGIARAADALRGFPDQVAVLLSVELCSLTLQRGDLSIPNLIASGLFGDGAAAVVVTGDARPAPGPRIVATRSVFYPDTEHVMGWEVGSGGFRVVLSGEVPEVARGIRKDVVELPRRARPHPRGRRRLRVPPRRAEGARGLRGGPRAARARRSRSPGRACARWGTSRAPRCSWCSATRSPSGSRRPAPAGLLLAMGPGFCAELVLLQW